jgi:hypothetical protein
MKLLVTATAALALLGTGSTYAQTVEISPNGSRRAAPAPAEYFTGSVLVEPLFGAKDSMPGAGGLVTFAPGAYHRACRLATLASMVPSLCFDLADIPWVQGRCEQASFLWASWATANRAPCGAASWVGDH